MKVFFIFECLCAPLHPTRAEWTREADETLLQRLLRIFFPIRRMKWFVFVAGKVCLQCLCVSPCCIPHLFVLAEFSTSVFYFRRVSEQFPSLAFISIVFPYTYIGPNTLPPHYSSSTAEVLRPHYDVYLLHFPEVVSHPITPLT